MTNQDLRAKFNILPQDVKDWLSSLESAYKMIDLNARLNLNGKREGVLAGIVFRLVTQDLHPQDVVNTIALELRVGDGAAKAITKLLEEQVLHRIEQSLRVAGIEVQALHFEGDKTLQPIANLEEVAATPVASIILTQTVGKIATSGIPPRNDNPNVAPRNNEFVMPTAHNDIVAPGVWKHVDESTLAAPVILHTEKEETAPITQAPRAIFSVKIPTNKKQYVSAPAPLAANVEIPGALNSNLEKQSIDPQPPMRALSDIKSVAPKSMATLPASLPLMPKIMPVVAKIPLRRVVHYSDWRTLI